MKRSAILERLFSVWLLSVFALAQKDGSITGVVLGQDGKPLEKAKVHIAESKPVYGSRVIQFHETDAEGKFAINHVPFGSYVVLAGKESEGYADTKFAFYSNLDAPTVDLSSLIPAENVTVHLIKAGILHIGTINDATTGKPIRNCQITLKRADNPKFSISLSSSQENILVPSTVGVFLQIEAEGYQPWPLSDQATTGQIKLDPGQVFNLNVKLEPVDDAKAEVTRIVRRTLYEHPMEISHGTTLTSPVLPAKEDIQRLMQLGHAATDLLSAYLEPSANIVDQQVVLSLLNNLGSDEALDLLGHFAEKAQSPAVRSRALQWLAKDNRPQDRALIQKISIGDSAPEVREVADKLLKRN